MNTQTLSIVALCIAAATVLLLLTRLRRAEQRIMQLSDEAHSARQQIKVLSQERATAEAMRDGLLDVSTDPAVFIDADRRVVALNAAARATSLFEAGHSLIESTRSFELDVLAEETLLRKQELPREFMLNSVLYRARAAPMGSGAVIMLRDISELTRLGRARRDFVANISHELRTPLTAIRLLLDALRTEKTGTAAGRERLLDQIGDQTHTLTQMTQELSDLAQIESGQMPMRLVSASLRELADAVISRLSPQAQRANIRIDNGIDPQMRALVDPTQFQRVLSNLMHNAIKFTSHGSITLAATPETRDEEEWIKISVQDTGSGIPSDELPRIFERFYKVDRARGQSGTGLGLAIAKHIVEAHGGKIWAESVLGKGTTFFFLMPADG